MRHEMHLRKDAHPKSRAKVGQELERLWKNVLIWPDLGLAVMRK